MKAAKATIVKATTKDDYDTELRDEHSVGARLARNNPEYVASENTGQDVNNLYILGTDQVCPGQVEASMLTSKQDWSCLHAAKIMVMTVWGLHNDWLAEQHAQAFIKAGPTC